jgi:hypothetical protein
MDMVWMENLYKLKEKGQSTVEYILLFAVVISLVSFVFKSQVFLDLFGKNGKFADVYKRELEYSYTHGRYGRKSFQQPNYRSGKHDSYNDRFFGSRNAYP